MFIEVDICLTDIGTINPNGNVNIYCNTIPTPIVVNVPVVSLSGTNCPYKIEVPDDTTTITITEPETNCSVTLTIGPNPCSYQDCSVTDTIPANVNNTPFTACTGSIINAYCAFGAKFYNDITNLPKPIRITNTSNVNGLVVDSITNQVPIFSAITGTTLWGSGSTTSGRLNNTGIWTCSGVTAGNWIPLKQWIGFSTCIELMSSKVYYIGLAADNAFRFKINGNLIVEFLTNGLTYNFNYWYVFPIKLAQGVNIIELEGWNEVSFASFGAEIYDPVDYNTLINSTTTGTTGIVFTTADYRGGGEIILSPSNGYSCPDGYSLSTCAVGTPVCEKVGCTTIYC